VILKIYQISFEKCLLFKWLKTFQNKQDFQKQNQNVTKTCLMF